MRVHVLILAFLTLQASPARADFWGGDIPLLTEIVFNTLHSLYELQHQTNVMDDAMRGIDDQIHRMQTIASVIQPSTWSEWQNPQQAIQRLRLIYYTLPPEYRTEKSDLIEAELSRAMNMVARVSPEAKNSFLSGKELEWRGADASPGVAAKLTASGVGTLVAMEAQTQTIQSHITSLLAQMLADANEKETRALVTRGSGFSNVSTSLGGSQGWFSSLVKPLRWEN